jgi:predicted small lipoprotein YifL
MKRAFVVLAALALASTLAACGGRAGTLSVDVIVSPSDDPFAQATQVRVSVGDMNSKTFPVTGGHFDVKLGQKPDSNAMAVVEVDALDAAGTLLGYGKSGPITLVPADQSVSVWVGRPGKIVPAASKLPSPRAEMTAVELTGLGVLYAGGRDTTGAALRDTAVYDLAAQAVFTTPSLDPPARAGGTAIAMSTIVGAVYGGASSAGAGTTGAPTSSTFLFDPVGNVWAKVTDQPTDPRSFAPSALLATGATLIAGGFDGGGNALATAALVAGEPSPAVAPLQLAMVAARAGHAMAPMGFPEGGGAILFGGLPSGSSAPNAERFVGNSFQGYDVPGQVSRAGATATTLQSGNVAILGGRDASGVLATGFLLAPTTTPTVVTSGVALSIAREGHTATAVGADVLVCGGSDASGAPIASCDLVDGTTLSVKQTLPLAVGRFAHSAGSLASGNIVIAGGYVAGGLPTDSIEIFTPAR